MGRMYFLDLLTLVETFNVEAAILTTKITRKIPGISEPSTGYVHVQGGKIVSCMIEGQSGAQLVGEPAFRILRSIEEWTVELPSDRTNSMNDTWEQPPSPPPPPVPPATSSTIPGGLIPRQLVLLSPTLFHEMEPRRRMIYRTVMAMVNGQRNVEQIREQLRLSPDVVNYVLEDLHRMGLIE